MRRRRLRCCHCRQFQYSVAAGMGGRRRIVKSVDGLTVVAKDKGPALQKGLMLFRGYVKGLGPLFHDRGQVIAILLWSGRTTSVADPTIKE